MWRALIREGPSGATRLSIGSLSDLQGASKELTVAPRRLVAIRPAFGRYGLSAPFLRGTGQGGATTWTQTQEPDKRAERSEMRSSTRTFASFAPRQDGQPEPNPSM